MILITADLSPHGWFTKTHQDAAWPGTSNSGITWMPLNRAYLRRYMNESHSLTKRKSIADVIVKGPRGSHYIEEVKEWQWKKFMKNVLHWWQLAIKPARMINPKRLKGVFGTLRWLKIKDFECSDAIYIARKVGTNHLKIISICLKAKVNVMTCNHL